MPPFAAFPRKAGKDIGPGNPKGHRSLIIPVSYTHLKCTPPGGNTTAGAELSAERRAYLRQVRRQKQEITLWRAGVLVGLLLLWEIAARLGWIDSFIMSSPSRILDTLFSLADNQILMHFSVTLYETCLLYTSRCV